jgi:glutamate--cysteine ligase
MSHDDSQRPGQWIAELFRSSPREVSERRVGIEVERIAIWNDGQPWTYTERKTPDGRHRIGAEQLLTELSSQHDWSLIKNQENHPLGIASSYGKVSLEPGSQVELSTEPLRDLVQVKKTVDAFEKEVAKITDPHGLVWLDLGVNPISKLEEIDVIPSTRYAIMTDYLGKRDTLGTSMMRRTSSVQINLDYTTEEEGIEMLRVALAAAPISYALFANSPFLEKKKTDFLSYRCEIWRRTDPDRTGLLPQVFQEGFNFDRYSEMLWHMPLMFVQDRKNLFHPGQGKSLNDIANGKLPGICVTENNQWNAIREMFAEARIKPGYVEIRSLDGQSPQDRYAASAFWLGLLYSKEARKLALQLLGKISTADREKLLLEASKKGLNASLPGLNIKQICQGLVESSTDCLKSRGFGEEKLLEPLFENLKAGVTPAEKHSLKDIL